MRLKISRSFLAEWLTTGKVMRYRVLEGIPEGAEVVQIIDDPLRDELVIVLQVDGVVTDEEIFALCETLNFAHVAEVEALITSTRYYVPKE